MPSKRRQHERQLQELKAAAAGRWATILSSLAHLDPDLLDGDGHPCPRCGGDDRFSTFREDFAETGGLICRHCFNRKNGDGFSALEWLNGWSFQQAMQAVADHLGVTLVAGRKRKSRTPDDRLDFLPWNDGTETIAHLWTLKKPGVTVEAIIANGGFVARYLGQFTVVALAVLDASVDVDRAIGWVIWNATGGELPKFDKHGRIVEWVKMKTTAGSQAGLMGLWGLRRLATAERAWKVEGPRDMLALWAAIPAELRETHVVITNSAGANENPQPWYVEKRGRRSVGVVHDADKPGQGM